MTLVDWGPLPAETLAPLYRAEASRWRAALAWDTTATWATIESARITWGLPGLVCRDTAGEIRGWAYFMRHNDRVELGGLVSDSAEATAALVDGVSREGARLGGFVYAGAIGLHEALAARRVTCDRYAYLVRPTAGVPAHRPTDAVRPWTPQDLHPTAALLRDAYGASGHLFAGDGSLDEWLAYVQNLVTFAGCGQLRPDLSGVIDAEGCVTAVALVTELASDTAHLAQLAVDPQQRRSGLGHTLLADALRAAHAAGFARMSLLASDSNTAARRLYDNWEFKERGEFLALG